MTDVFGNSVPGTPVVNSTGTHVPASRSQEVLFNVGDRVRRTKAYCLARLGGFDAREVGTVASVSPGVTRSVMVVWPSGTTRGNSYAASELEHVTDDFHRQELDDPAPADMPVRAQILREAETVITKNRHDQYGSAEDCFGDIAALWTTYFRRTFSAHDVAMAMSLLKIARTKANPKHKDNLVDLCGYAALAAEMES